MGLHGDFIADQPLGRGGMTERQKLERLLFLLEDASDYKEVSYSTCLLARACADPVFRDAGLVIDRPTVSRCNPIVGEFFGYKPDNAALVSWRFWFELFGILSVAEKRDLIIKRLASL